MRKVVKFTYFGAHKGYEAQGEVAFVQYFEEVKSTLGHKDRLRRLKCFKGGVHTLTKKYWEIIDVDLLEGEANLELVSKEFGWWVWNEYTEV